MGKLLRRSLEAELEGERAKGEKRKRRDIYRRGKGRTRKAEFRDANKSAEKLVQQACVSRKVGTEHRESRECVLGKGRDTVPTLPSDC